MQAWKRRAAWLIPVLALVGIAALPGLEAVRGAEQAAKLPANVTVDPQIYGGLTFRSLENVFSRGGRSTAVAGVTTNDQLYYVGYTGGGVWRTDDAGQTWRNLSDGFFEAGSIGAIAVSQSNPSVIYVGTGSACPRGNVSPGIGMYKSSDEGKTWAHIGLRNAGQIGRVVVHPTSPDIVYVAALGNMFGPNKERGLYRSRDGGRTWALVHFISDRTGAIDITMNPKDPDTLIAGMWTTERKPWTIESGSSEGGLFRTTDGGDTWTKLTQGLPAKTMVGKVGVSISPANPQRVYAQIEAGDDQGGTYRSDDGGTTWKRTNQSRDLQQRAWYYTHIHADPVDVDTVYALNVGAFKSTDGGITFQGGAIQSHSDHHDLWINPRNNRALVGGNDGGGTVKLNDASWTGQNNQPTAEMYRVEVDTRWPYWVYGGQQDNSTIAVPSQGNAETYSVGGGESGHIAVDPRDHNIVYAGNYGGTISRQDRHFTPTRSENVRVYADSQTGQRAADMKYRFQWNSPIEISPHTPDVVYTMSQHVHRTTNGGLDWEVISPDLTRNDKRRQQYSGGEGITRDNTGVEVYGTVFAFEESRRRPGLIWAGSDDGLVHISRDNGKTWVNVTPKDWPEGCINAISPSMHDDGRATLAMYRYRQADFRPYIYQTNDYGKTWRRLADGSNGIPDWHFTRVVREDTVRRGLLYAGTEFGIYVSFDDGAHWQSLQLNLPITPITDLNVHRDDLVVGTQGRGYWIMDDLTVLRGLRPAAQAQPAPQAMLFKPSDGFRQTGRPPTIQYWLRDAPTAPVTIEISNAKGEVVASTTVQPNTPVPPAPVALGGGGRGRGGGGGRGGGRGAAAAEPPGRGAPPAGVQPPADPQRGRGAGARGGGGGGRGGRGGGGGGPAINGSAVQGMNRAIWTNLRLPAVYQPLQGAVMWGGGGGGQGPKVPVGTYTVKVSSGPWSATETFRLRADPRYSPEMTDAEGEEQLRMALEVGGWLGTLYGNVRSMRDVKQQADELAKKAGANSPVAPAARTLRENIEAVEGDMTQLRGSSGQDALNFPGRMDNQLVVLYGNVVGVERRLGSPITDRYKDLKPEAEKLLQRGAAALKTEVAAFNAVAQKAGVGTITVK